MPSSYCKTVITVQYVENAQKVPRYSYVDKKVEKLRNIDEELKGSCYLCVDNSN